MIYKDVYNGEVRREVDSLTGEFTSVESEDTYIIVSPFTTITDEDINLRIDNIIVMTKENGSISISNPNDDSKFSEVLFDSGDKVRNILVDIMSDIPLIDRVDQFLNNNYVVYLQKAINGRYNIVYVADWEGNYVYIPDNVLDIVVNNGVYKFKNGLENMEDVTYTLDGMFRPRKIKMIISNYYRLFYRMYGKNGLNGYIDLRKILSNEQLEIYGLVEVALQHTFQEILDIYNNQKPQLLQLKGYGILNDYWGTPLNFILERFQAHLLEDEIYLEDVLMRTPYGPKLMKLWREYGG